MKLAIVSMAAAAGIMLAGNVLAATDMPLLEKKHNCSACHAIDKKIVGPSWRNVANKYRGIARFTYNGKTYPLLEGLVMKVSKGGSGNWGAMPMPANDSAGTKQSEITELVKFVLSLPAN